MAYRLIGPGLVKPGHAFHRLMKVLLALFLLHMLFTAVFSLLMGLSGATMGAFYVLLPVLPSVFGLAFLMNRNGMYKTLNYLFTFFTIWVPIILLLILGQVILIPAETLLPSTLVIENQKQIITIFSYIQGGLMLLNVILLVQEPPREKDLEKLIRSQVPPELPREHPIDAIHSPLGARTVQPPAYREPSLHQQYKQQQHVPPPKQYVPSPQQYVPPPQQDYTQPMPGYPDPRSMVSSQVESLYGSNQEESMYAESEVSDRNTEYSDLPARSKRRTTLFQESMMEDERSTQYTDFTEEARTTQFTDQTEARTTQFTDVTDNKVMSTLSISDSDEEEIPIQLSGKKWTDERPSFLPPRKTKPPSPTKSALKASPASSDDLPIAKKDKAEERKPRSRRQPREFPDIANIKTKNSMTLPREEEKQEQKDTPKQPEPNKPTVLSMIKVKEQVRKNSKRQRRPASPQPKQRPAQQKQRPASPQQKPRQKPTSPQKPRQKPPSPQKKQVNFASLPEIQSDPFLSHERSIAKHLSPQVVAKVETPVSPLSASTPTNVAMLRPDTFFNTDTSSWSQPVVQVPKKSPRALPQMVQHRK